MFLSAVRLGDYVYGTSGDFGPAFLTALDVKTGEAAWRHRGFPRASIIYADGKAIILDEDGDLAIAKLSPKELTILARAKVLETTAWSAPSLVGTTLYVGFTSLRRTKVMEHIGFLKRKMKRNLPSRIVKYDLSRQQPIGQIEFQPSEMSVIFNIISLAG